MKPSTKDQITGKLHQVKGKVKETAGRATNNPDLAAEGQGEKLGGKILKKAADLIRERTDHIARIATIEEGKTLTEAKWEAGLAADIFEWYAEEGRRAYGRVLPQRASGVRRGRPRPTYGRRRTQERGQA